MNRMKIIVISALSVAIILATALGAGTLYFFYRKSQINTDTPVTENKTKDNDLTQSYPIDFADKEIVIKFLPKAEISRTRYDAEIIPRIRPCNDLDYLEIRDDKGNSYELSVYAINCSELEKRQSGHWGSAQPTSEQDIRSLKDGKILSKFDTSLGPAISYSETYTVCTSRCETSKTNSTMILLDDNSSRVALAKGSSAEGEGYDYLGELVTRKITVK
ncbi:hypothetical protein KBC31_02245 [Candidatus Saccharibacteria bacterium]|jgi:hypothetical protein|nr:hypothetical protein [Candidatus Saccharibacteria bacterium]